MRCDVIFLRRVNLALKNEDYHFSQPQGNILCKMSGYPTDFFFYGNVNALILLAAMPADLLLIKLCNNIDPIAPSGAWLRSSLISMCDFVVILRSDH